MNYSNDMRAFPQGLVNISRRGIRDIDFRWEQGNRKYISFRSGNRYYYTRFIMGFRDWNFVKNSDTLVFGFGAGFRVSLRPFYFEFEIDARTALEDYAEYSSVEESWENLLILPTFNLTLGLGRNIGIYGGVSLTLKTPGMNRESALLDSGSRWNMSSDGQWAGVFKWYAGFHF